MQVKINESALFHQAISAWCALQDQKTLRLTLRTQAGDFSKVCLTYFPYYDLNQIRYPDQEMEAVLRDEKYYYYQVTLYDIPVKGLVYYFKLHKPEDTITYCYTEMGISQLNTLQENSTLWSYSFKYPYMNNIDIHYVPEWAKGAVTYQIFPDRFARSDKSILKLQERGAEILPWGSPPNAADIIGGDLQGVIDKLEYLAELGIEVIYMTPIFKARSNHKYDTTDYKQIDPAFGSNEDFHKLVQECHKLGIRIILDAVFNHCGADFSPFVDVLENGKNSKYLDWFHILRWPVISPDKLRGKLKQGTNNRYEGQYSTTILGKVEVSPIEMGEDGQTTPPYETFAYVPEMPKLNTQNAEMKEYLLEVAEYWIREYDIDGWRLDVANEVDHVFWREFRSRVRTLKPDTLIIGEIWHDASPWLLGDQFDCVMNYPFRNISFDFFLNGYIDSARTKQLFNALLLRYTPQVNQVQWNILDTHDTERLMHACSGDEQKVLLLLGLLFCYIGIPLLYYGTEVGLGGGADPDCRRCMPWDQKSWNKVIFQAVQHLIALRKSYSVLRTGSLRWIDHHSPDLLAFERFDPSGKEPSRKIILNRAEKPVAFAELAGQKDLLHDKIFDGKIGEKTMIIL